MGPKKPAVSDLAAVAPSEDEPKEAREALKKLDGAELKRQKANMAYWLKSRGQEKSAGVRGEDRLRWLEEYFVLKAREKNASRTTSTSHNYAITTKKATKKQWWNKFQLESKLGCGAHSHAHQLGQDADASLPDHRCGRRAQQIIQVQL